MGKISIKLAAFFMIPVVLIELIMLLYLHPSIQNARVKEELNQLMERGMKHSQVLEDNFSETTIHHIVLMESESDREVVILDKNLNLIESTNIDQKRVLPILEYLSSHPIRNKIIQSKWKNKDYFISAHHYSSKDGDTGYIILYQSTKTLNELIKKLNFHFVLATVGSLLVMIVVYFTLSRFLTAPLIRMKDATEKLSQGDFEVTLPILAKDEIGELSNSIQSLSNDLQKIKNDRKEFFASISHELRTPLTYISGYTQIAMRTTDSQKREKYLTIIQEEMNRLTNLVKDLFELAKMDETNFVIQKENIEAASFFQVIYERIVPSFQLKNMDIIYKCSEPFLFQADPIRLEQITMNLLNNALNYSNPGTTVQLTIEQQNGRFKLAVKDHGVGMNQDEIQYIFDRLYRAEKSRSRDFGGSGLGLAIVKELVEAHDGKIYVTSEVGKGSEFIVEL